MEGVTTPLVKNHYPALPLEQLPERLERIDDYQQGRQLTRLAVAQYFKNRSLVPYYGHAAAKPDGKAGRSP